MAGLRLHDRLSPFTIMWNPDREPKLSFEKLAKRVGVIKARAMWEAHRQRYLAHHAQARKQEERAAAARHRRGAVVVRNDFDMVPFFYGAPITYKELYRSTLGQRGCKGGEVFEDDGYMKDFIKLNPNCAPPKIVTGDIRSGWTPALERAAAEGRINRVRQFAETSLRLQAAAAEKPLLTD